MIVIPDIIILQSIKSVLKKIRDDYNVNIATPEKSILFKLLNGNNLQRFKMFEEAVKIIMTTENDPRHLDANLYFNAKRASIPTLHITLSSENLTNNALGQSLGYQDTLYSQDLTNFQDVWNRRFSANYSLIITSDNMNEVILLYNLWKSILISITYHLNLSGLENIKLSGGNIQINSNLVPENIFSRSIGINFEYDTKAIDLFNSDTFIYDILVDSIPNKID